MAVGIAEGVATGFGLVGDVYDRKAKRERLLKQDEWQEDERKWRRDQAAEQQRYNRGRDALADDRYTEQLGLTAEQKEYTRGRNEKLDARAAARDARTVAQTDITNARQADLAARQAAKAVRDQGDYNREQAARVWSAISKAYAAGDFDGVRKLATDPALTDDHNAFRVANILDPAGKDNWFTVSDEIVRITQNNEDLSTLSPSAIGAIQSLFDVNGAEIVGRTIVGDDFPNAPEGAEGEVIRGINIVRLKHADGVDDNGNPVNGLSAVVAVEYTDKETGTTTYYYAPLTEGRSGSTEPVVVPIDDGIAALAGNAYMKDFLRQDPALSYIIEEELLKLPRYKREYETHLETLQDMVANAEDSSTLGSLLGNDGMGARLTPSQVDFLANNSAKTTDALIQLAKQWVIYGEPQRAKVQTAQSRYAQNVEQVLNLNVGQPTQKSQQEAKVNAMTGEVEEGSSAVSAVKIRDMLKDGEELPDSAVGNIIAMSKESEATPEEIEKILSYLRTSHAGILKQEHQGE